MRRIDDGHTEACTRKTLLISSYPEELHVNSSTYLVVRVVPLPILQSGSAISFFCVCW